MGMVMHMFLPKLLFAAGFKTVNNDIMKIIKIIKKTQTL